MKRRAERFDSAPRATLLVASDVHGRLALLFRIAAEYEAQSGRALDAIVVSGDLGVWPDDRRLDTSTRKRSRDVPDELGFRAFAPRVGVRVQQDPPSDALARHVRAARTVLRASLARTRANLYFIGGNHEDFEYLEACREAAGGEIPVPIDETGRVYWLPSGTCLELATAAGALSISGVSGISAEECGRDPGRYHPLALLDDAAAVAVMANVGRCDLLLTHDSVRDFVVPGRGARLVDELVAAVAPSLHVSGHYHERRTPEPYATFDAARFGGIETLGVHVDSLVPGGDGRVSPNAVGVVTAHARAASEAPRCAFAFADASFLARFRAASGVR